MPRRACRLVPAASLLALLALCLVAAEPSDLVIDGDKIVAQVAYGRRVPRVPYGLQT